MEENELDAKIIKFVDELKMWISDTDELIKMELLQFWHKYKVPF